LSRTKKTDRRRGRTNKKRNNRVGKAAPARGGENGDGPKKIGVFGEATSWPGGNRSGKVGGKSTYFSVKRPKRRGGERESLTTGSEARCLYGPASGAKSNVYGPKVYGFFVRQCTLSDTGERKTHSTAAFGMELPTYGP